MPNPYCVCMNAHVNLLYKTPFICPITIATTHQPVSALTEHLIIANHDTDYNINYGGSNGDHTTAVDGHHSDEPQRMGA